VALETLTFAGQPAIFVWLFPEPKALRMAAIVHISARMPLPPILKAIVEMQGLSGKVNSL
jgi:hypothetical protein